MAEALRDCTGSDEPTQSSSLSVLVPSALALLTSSHSYRLSAAPTAISSGWYTLGLCDTGSLAQTPLLRLVCYFRKIKASLVSCH